MEKATYTEITNYVTNFVTELGSYYKLVPLKYKKTDGSVFEVLIVEINGQNLLQIDSANTIVPFLLSPKTKYQKPIYHCQPNEKGLYCLLKNSEVVINYNVLTCEDVVRIVFGDIKTKLSNIPNVVELLSNFLPIFLPEEIGYDANEKSYFIVDWEKQNGKEALFF